MVAKSMRIKIWSIHKPASRSASRLPPDINMRLSFCRNKQLQGWMRAVRNNQRHTFSTNSASLNLVQKAGQMDLLSSKLQHQRLGLGMDSTYFRPSFESHDGDMLKNDNQLRFIQSTAAFDVKQNQVFVSPHPVLDKMLNPTPDREPIFQRKDVLLSILLENIHHHAAFVHSSLSDIQTLVATQVPVLLKSLEQDSIDLLMIECPGDAPNPEILSTLHAAMKTAIEQGQIQSYGLALTSVPSIASTFFDCAQMRAFPALQFPLSGLPTLAKTRSFISQCHEHQVFTIADKPIEARNARGRPFHYITKSKNQNLAQVSQKAKDLQKAFEIAIPIEMKYANELYPRWSEEGHASSEKMPEIEAVGWGHILARQMSDFGSVIEWKYVQDSQIIPQLEALGKAFFAIVKAQEGNAALQTEVKEFTFAYTVAIRQLLTQVTLALELQEVRDNEARFAHLNQSYPTLSQSSPTLEQLVVRLALASTDVHMIVAPEDVFTRAFVDHVHHHVDTDAEQKYELDCLEDKEALGEAK